MVPRGDLAPPTTQGAREGDSGYGFASHLRCLELSRKMLVNEPARPSFRYVGSGLAASRPRSVGALAFGDEPVASLSLRTIWSACACVS